MSAGSPQQSQVCTPLFGRDSPGPTAHWRRAVLAEGQCSQGGCEPSRAPTCRLGPRGCRRFPRSPVCAWAPCRPSLLPCANRSALSGCPLHLPPAPYLFRGLTLGNHFPPLLGHPHWSRCTVMLPIPDAHLEPCLYLATEPRLLSRSWLHRPLCALLSSQPRSNQAFICPVLLKGHRQPPVDRSNG